jgi:hypothetical protein
VDTNAWSWADAGPSIKAKPATSRTRKKGETRLMNGPHIIDVAAIVCAELARTQ